MLSLKIIFSTLNHWKLTPIHLLNTIMWSSQNSQNVFCVFIYDYSWTTKSSETQILTHLFHAFLWKRWLGGKCFASVCWSFSLFVGWPVCTVSVACSISFYPLPERYLIGTMVSSGEWMIPKSLKSCVQRSMSNCYTSFQVLSAQYTSILCLIFTKLGTVFAPRE